MDRRGLVVGAVAAVLTLSGCTESGSPPPATTPVTTSSALSPEQQDNLRIVERLAELGCDTSGCIQTYFACKDGYLTGEACDFYRKNPL
ncbi:hypothetical protein [Nocardia shimofusensis]|uniref:hypothetical protein n=1 Tax=Nocardia shimofusensis TaxID=228596 RepID=UPI0008377087|nr:hypothetical protein [Nocardia shimofusensis]